MSISFVIDNDFLLELRNNNIFETRTGMKRTFQTPIYRWKKGEALTFEKDTVLEAYSTIADGNSLYTIGSFSSVASNFGTRIKVGRYSEIAVGCKRFGFRHPMEALSINSAFFNYYRENVYSYFEDYERNNNTVITKKSVPTPQPQREIIEVGNDVWIGSDVKLSGGITIGNGAVVASNSVVTKDIPPYAVVGGVPATIKKYRYSDSIIEKIIESEWFEYELGDMNKLGLDFSAPEKFLEDFYKHKQSLRRYCPKTWSPFIYCCRKYNKELLEEGYLLSQFFTVLQYDFGTQRLVHSYLGKNGELVPVKVIIDYNRCVLIVNNYYIKEIFNDGKVILTDNVSYFDIIGKSIKSISKNGLFISARKNGNISLVSNCQEWEEFLVYKWSISDVR